MRRTPVLAFIHCLGLMLACSGGQQSAGGSGTGGLSTASTGGSSKGAGGTSAYGGTTGQPSTGGVSASRTSSAVAGESSANLGGATSNSGGRSSTGNIGGTQFGGGSTSASGGSAAAVSSSAATGGRSAPTSTNASGGTTGVSGATSIGECEPGTSATAWATSCPSAPTSTCVAGTWLDGGPQNDTCCSAMKKCSESDHFVVYSDETCSAAADTAVKHLETVWSLYFGSPMFMREPYCDSKTKYKANVHVHSDWGLTGGSFGSNRMGMWIGSGGLSDHWGLAHEFMHGVQSVSGGMVCNSANTCGWIYESHANWAAQQQTEFHTTNVHCSEYLNNAPHLYLGSTRDRYCNWQFMEYLKDKYCYSAVNAIWTGKATDDPFTAIMNGQGWSLDQLNDFIGDWAMHNVTWDYQDPPPEATAGGNQGTLFRSKYGLATDTSQTWRRLRVTKVEPLGSDYGTTRRFISPVHWAPQRFGYNVIRLFPDAGAASVTIKFRGVTAASPSPDWRWGLVATDAGVAKPRYSALQMGSDSQLTFCVNANEYLWLVVAATPSTQQKIVWDQAFNTVPRYPYMFELTQAWPDGFRDGVQDPCPTGLSRAANGGGCAPSGTAAYVGPYATVASGATVGATAKIMDHAFVEKGSTVSGGTVGALSLIGSAGTPGNSFNFTVSGGTAATTFFPLGWFANGQSLSGGSLIGDVEFQGASVNHASGDCSGFVDATSCTAPGTDNTPAPPYVWRP